MNAVLLRVALLLFMLLHLSQPAWSQVNDDCFNATPIADPTNFCSLPQGADNTLATPSALPVPTCFDNADSDVWFCFTAVASELVLVINAFNGNLFQPSVALYSGACPNQLTELNCETDLFNTDVIELRQSQLTPGEKYYFRVDGLFPGTFQYCIRNYFGVEKTSSDCPKAIPICDKATFNVQAVAGPGTDPSELDGAPCYLGAISGETNSTWYTFTASNNGPLTFTLTPNNPTDDLDFVVYRLPNGPGNCTGKVVERCMNAGDFLFPSPCMGPTGLNLTSTDIDNPPGCAGISDNFLKYLDMTAGTSYALVVNNFTSSGNGFQIEWGGTGEFTGPDPGFKTDEADNKICTGEDIVFTDTSSFPGGFGAITGWHWNFGADATLDTANTQGPHTVQYTTKGLKTIALTLTTSIGCEVTVTRQIEVEPCCIFQADVVVTPGCPGSAGATAAVETTNGALPLSYQWSNGAQSQVTTGLQTGNYSVSVQDAAGCKDTVSFTVTTPLNISVFLPKDTSIVKGTEAVLNLSSSNTILQASWATNKDTLTGTSVKVKPESTTSYLLTAIIGNCTIVDTVTITVVEELFERPNAFTPNGDQVNDQLRPAIIGYTLVRMEVWSRWGKLVYDSDIDVPNTGWDGTFNGEPAPADIYFCRMVVRRLTTGEEVVKQGDVTLLR